MKRKILIALLSAATATCCAVGLAACKDTDTGKPNNGTQDRYPYYVREEEPPTNLEFAYDENGNIVIGEQSAKLGEDGNTNVVIPSKVNDVPVTEIAANAFIGNANITSVTIPDTVTKIGANAFSNCTNLKSIQIPDSVTELGTGIFSGCSALIGVTFGTGVKTIPKGAFQSCTGLLSITIPTTIETIGESAFNSCTTLRTVNMDVDPETGLTGVKTIGVRAFSNCSKLNTCIIAEGVVTVAEKAFEKCGSLRKLVIPNTVESIGQNLLDGTYDLDFLTLPFVGAHRVNPSDTPAEMGKYDFYGWLYGGNNYEENYDYTNKLDGKTVTITVTGVSDESPIGYGAFYNARGIGMIIIKGTPTVLKESSLALINASMAPVSVVLPKTITRLEWKAMWGSSDSGRNIIYWEGDKSEISVGIDNGAEGGSMNDGYETALKYYYSPNEYKAGHWHYVDGLPELY